MNERKPGSEKETMQRIAVIGCPGAGKSTLAIRLSVVTGLPLIHLDALYHGRVGDAETLRAQWLETHAVLIAAPRWIIDGNYQRTLADRITAADTVVFLDFPRWQCLYRVVRRRVLQVFGHAAAGANPERLNGDFLTFIWHFARKERPRILQLLAQKQSNAPNTRVYRLRSQAAIEHFLTSLP